MADKVDPPFDEVEIEERYNQGGKGSRKPYLVISMEALEAILECEEAVIANDDVPRLLAALCGYAINAGFGDEDLAKELYEQYSDEVEDEEP